MLPYITVGQIKISTYYSAMVLGFVLMVMLMLQKERRQKYALNSSKSILFATSGLIVGILGCKALYVIENLTWVKNNGFTFGGFSFYGAVFLTPLMMPLIGKLLNLNWRNTLDNSAICILAMLGTIRIGCYFNGCCGSRIFNIGDFYFSLPIQLIECIFDFLILNILLKREKNGENSGFLYSTFLLLYGSARFVIEFFRNTEKDWLYFSHAQWFSIAAIIIGAMLKIIMQKQTKNTVEDQISHLGSE